jgi:hypothetical protein
MAKTKATGRATAKKAGHKAPKGTPPIISVSLGKKVIRKAAPKTAPAVPAVAVTPVPAAATHDTPKATKAQKPKPAKGHGKKTAKRGGAKKGGKKGGAKGTRGKK